MNIYFPRGTTAQNNQLVLPEGFVTIDTQRKAIRIHDGETQGGFELVGTQAVIPPVGQMQWATAGNWTWIVPDKVTRVCVLVVGPGERPAVPDGRQDVDHRKGGMGGGLRYRNDVPVVPGQAITIKVGSAGSALSNQASALPRFIDTTVALGLTAGAGTVGTALGNGVFGGVGGNAGRLSVQNTTAGNSALTNNGSSDPGSQLYGSRTGQGVILSGNAFIRSTNQSYGGGGWGQWNKNSDRGLANPGGGGYVRIIWGPNRAFPNINIGNVTPYP